MFKQLGNSVPKMHTTLLDNLSSFKIGYLCTLPQIVFEHVLYNTAPHRMNTSQLVVVEEIEFERSGAS